MAKRLVISKTPLFLALKYRITSISNRQLVIELNKVVKKLGVSTTDASGCDPDSTRLTTAFIWEMSPQGSDFWMNLFHEAYMARNK